MQVKQHFRFYSTATHQSSENPFPPEDSTLEEIVSSNPLIERFFLSGCLELPTIQPDQPRKKRTSFAIFNTKPTQTFNTIGLNLNSHDKYLFPRLKSLYLGKVGVFTELFESFSSNFPSLEELELQSCSGFSEIQLTVSKMKRLVITIDSIESMVITIYAPNIRCFVLSVLALPELIFYTETEREWKSHVVVLFDKLCYAKVLPLQWLIQLSELLNSLRESQISLNLFPNPFKNLKVENTNDVVFCKAVPLELVCLKGDVFRDSSFVDFLDCLFLICWPRYMCVNWYPTDSKADSKKGKEKLAGFIIFEFIRNHGRMSRGFLWERDLEEISMQVWDENSKGWHNVCVAPETKIRFPLKWKG